MSELDDSEAGAPLDLSEEQKQRRSDLLDSPDLALAALHSYWGLNLRSSDLLQGADLASFLNFNGDLTDSETNDLITTTQVIDQIIVYCDDVAVIHH